MCFGEVQGGYGDPRAPPPQRVSTRTADQPHAQRPGSPSPADIPRRLLHRRPRETRPQLSRLRPGPARGTPHRFSAGYPGEANTAPARSPGPAYRGSQARSRRASPSALGAAIFPPRAGRGQAR